MIFYFKKIYNLDPYNVCLSYTKNVPVLYKTGFVIQGHLLFLTPEPQTETLTGIKQKSHKKRLF